MAENRIDACFAGLKARGRKGLMAYITAGDPNLARSHDLVLALEEAGADLVELGVPFSDPLADGVVNQLAADRAIKAGATLAGVLELVRGLRSVTEIPLILYTYLNPIYQHGFERFYDDAAAAGVDGVLVLDLPPEEEALNVEFAHKRDVRTIRLVAPTTPPERMASITAAGSGFIYYVSREGVTGERSELAEGIGEQVAQLRSFTDLPIAVGFGISKPEQAASVARHADAVVVGSAIVRQVADAGDSPELTDRIVGFVKPLADAVHATK